jgi:bacterioferritin
MNDLITLIQSAINDEWKSATIYEIQKTMIKGLLRDPIGEHFEEHAEEEERHAEKLTLHLFSRGVDVNVVIPEFNVGSTVEEMLRIDLQLEIDAIDKYSKILSQCENIPEIKDTKMLIEDILLDEVAHQDEFAAMLRTKIQSKEKAIKSASTMQLLSKAAYQMDKINRPDIADKFTDCIIHLTQ